jgi:hypothetical protein
LGVSLGREPQGEGEVGLDLHRVPPLGDLVGEGALWPLEAGEEAAVLHLELGLVRDEAHRLHHGVARGQVGGLGIVADGGALVGLDVPAHHLALGVEGQVHEVGDGHLFRHAVPVHVHVLEARLQGQGGKEEEGEGNEAPHRRPSLAFLGGKTGGTGSSPPGWRGWHLRRRRAAR